MTYQKHGYVYKFTADFLEMIRTHLTICGLIVTFNFDLEVELYRFNGGGGKKVSN